jgi:hypothetical protein
MRINVVTGLLSIGLIFVLVGPVAGAGIGISPAKLNYENVLRGGSMPGHFTIFNNADEELYFNLSVDGEGVSEDWFSFEPSSPVRVPAKGNTKVKAVVNPPSDTPSGVYEATIYIRSTAKVEGEEGAAVMGVIPGMGLKTTIEVTGTQILKGDVRDITARDVEKGYPLRIKLLFRNTGNVVAEPEISASITKDNISIADSLSSKDSVKPDETKTVSLEWDTEGRETGEYEADISVILGDDTLAEEEIKFNILPVGTLTREGKLLDLSYEGSPVVGRVLEINEVFKNTGEMDTYAKPNAKVFLYGDLLGVIEGEEKLIDVGTEVTLTCYLEITEPGNYKIAGFVAYGGKETEKKEISFDVGEGEAHKNNSLLIYTISAIVIISTIILFGLLIRRRRRKE